MRSNMRVATLKQQHFLDSALELLQEKSPDAQPPIANVRSLSMDEREGVHGG